MKEIGSEFWATESIKGQELFFVSGRTALDFIIRDIIAEHYVGTVFLPALCCHSMIEPFLANGLSVSFYEVSYKNGILAASIPPLCKRDVFFFMEFFGFEGQNMGDISQIKKSGCIVIKDATHSWLTDNNKKDNSPADYTFISYRKWTGFTGLATAKKAGGRFTISQKPVFHKEYEQLRLLAQEKKRQYIELGCGNKEEFLSAFSDAEELLDKNYADYLPVPESLSALLNLDQNQISAIRRQNAAELLEGISHVSEITPFFPRLGKKDVPLCVPVLVDASIRDPLRKHLIARQIYCPIHWPLSDLHKDISPCTAEIYKSQLSLICDQRYGISHMKHIIKCIGDFFDHIKS